MEDKHCDDLERELVLRYLSKLYDACGEFLVRTGPSPIRHSIADFDSDVRPLFTQVLSWLVVPSQTISKGKNKVAPGSSIPVRLFKLPSDTAALDWLLSPLARRDFTAGRNRSVWPGHAMEILCHLTGLELDSPFVTDLKSSLTTKIVENVVLAAVFNPGELLDITSRAFLILNMDRILSPENNTPSMSTLGVHYHFFDKHEATNHFPRSYQ